MISILAISLTRMKEGAKGKMKYQACLKSKLMAARRSLLRLMRSPIEFTIGAAIMAPPVTSKVPIIEGTTIIVSFALRKTFSKASTIRSRMPNSFIQLPKILIKTRVETKFRVAG